MLVNLSLLAGVLAASSAAAAGGPMHHARAGRPHAGRSAIQPRRIERRVVKSSSCVASSTSSAAAASATATAGGLNGIGGLVTSVLGVATSVVGGVASEAVGLVSSVVIGGSEPMTSAVVSSSAAASKTSSSAAAATSTSAATSSGEKLVAAHHMVRSLIHLLPASPLDEGLALTAAIASPLYEHWTGRQHLLVLAVDGMSSSPSSSPLDQPANCLRARLCVPSLQWASDIAQAAANGINAFALNVGTDSWQIAQVASAYAAAAAYGSSFKLFLSLDMTVFPCSSAGNADALVSIAATYAGHSNQATWQSTGKPIVSTFAGSDCTFVRPLLFPPHGSPGRWLTLLFLPLASAGPVGLGLGLADGRQDAVREPGRHRDVLPALRLCRHVDVRVGVRHGRRAQLELGVGFRRLGGDLVV